METPSIVSQLERQVPKAASAPPDWYMTTRTTSRADNTAIFILSKHNKKITILILKIFSLVTTKVTYQ